MKKVNSSTDQRISTGIPGLDMVLNGGLLPGRSYLIVGATGTGKTIFSLQWLLEGHRKGDKGIFISLAEPKCEIEQNISDNRSEERKKSHSLHL